MVLVTMISWAGLSGCGLDIELLAVLRGVSSRVAPCMWPAAESALLWSPFSQPFEVKH